MHPYIYEKHLKLVGWSSVDNLAWTPWVPLTCFENQYYKQIGLIRKRLRKILAYKCSSLGNDNNGTQIFEVVSLWGYEIMFPYLHDGDGD